MNSLEILQRIRDDLKNTDHWLATKHESGLVSMERRFLHNAEELRRARDERLAAIAANGPRVYFEDPYETMTIVLLRDGKEMYYSFDEFQVEILSTDDDCLRRRLRLEDPPDADGSTYFISATPMDYGVQRWGVQVSKEEAAILDKAIKALVTAAAEEFE